MTSDRTDAGIVTHLGTRKGTGVVPKAPEAFWGRARGHRDEKGDGSRSQGSGGIFGDGPEGKRDITE